ncbi:Cysteine protease [Mycena chlorophos]|uniref:Cysteine protease n=1 Tax=Mycena chlorophos TaxID=658473 RepID=A0A8H6RZ50_MYCCL|nr:Cysteine protease [Mycena chlorophos]
MSASKKNSASSSFYDKAVRYVFDTDAVGDRSSEDIYLLGLKHDGFRGSESSSDNTHGAQAQWPPKFFSHFRTIIWCTYRVNLTSKIQDGTRQFSGDAGWGCMIRTAQSLLANTLLVAHVGREWRRAPSTQTRSSFFFSSPNNTHRRDTSSTSASSEGTAERTKHMTYVRLISWFMDSPDAPFGIHRLCLAGRDLGTPVGTWFGPAVAANAIKTLVQAFPACGLGVSLAVDGGLYESTVFEASHSVYAQSSASWGDRPVLLLLGLRLGLDNVNPIYYSTIKELFTFPQSVGISGGRPSSSYYFVGAQGDGLIYLDPHHPRPALAIRPPLNIADLAPTELEVHAASYSPSEFDSYHCEKVHKMPISGLDPSMLLGFLVHSEEDWKDFRCRVLALPRTIFSIANEPPSWPSVDLDDDDDLLAVESLSSSSSEDLSSRVLAPRAVSSALGLETNMESNAAYEPQTPSHTNNQDLAQAGGKGRGRLSFSVEGLRSKLRTFGRSRSSERGLDS